MNNQKFRPLKCTVLKMANLASNVYNDDWCKGADGVYINNIETDTQVVCIPRNKKCVDVVFRGTSSGTDIFTDIKAWKSKIHTGECIHSGFLNSFLSIWSELKNFVSCFKYVNVSGHSLGGALSQIAGLYISDICNNVNVFTFGSPLVGNDSFIESLEESNVNIITIEHWFDCVTFIPTRLMGFRKHDNKVSFFRFNVFPSSQHEIKNYIDSIDKKYTKY